MKTLLGVGLALGIGLAGNAATIRTSAVCGDIAGHTHDIEANYCAAGSATGQATASFADQASATDYVTALLTNWARPGIAGAVDTSTSVSADLYTVGSERSGYMQLVTSIPQTFITADSAGGATSIHIGNYSLGCGWSIGAQYPCSQTPEGSGARLIPFTLGVPFAIDLTQRIGADSQMSGFGGGYSSIQFRFFESDGVTPVSDPEVASAPEPGTWGMMLLGALAVALFKLRSRGITIKAKPPQGLLCLGAVIVAAAVSTVPAFGSVIYRYEDKYWQTGPFENYPHDFIEVTATDYIQGSATFSGSQINCSNCSGTETISLTQHSVADAPYPFDSDVEMQFDDNGSSHSEWFYGARLDADGVFFEGAPSYGNRPALIIKDPPDTPVPEPGTLAFTGIAGCAGLIAFRRRV